MKRELSALIVVAVTLMFSAGSVCAQEILPFPRPPSASVAGRTLKESKHKWRQEPRHLPKDAPNIVIFMTDDAGFSNPEVFGGPVRMPTMDKLAQEGIAY
ncbi:MAG: arylsulfatase, partial [Thermodesulfobacteriota bacterium]